MSAAQLQWKNGALTRLLSASGQQWDEGSHYAVLVKNAKTPAATDTTYATISGNLCTSTNYAHQALANKAVNGAALTADLDCDDIDFTNGGADTQNARYLYVCEGSAGAPQATDAVLFHVDLNDGGNSNVDITGTIPLNANGFTRAQ